MSIFNINLLISILCFFLIYFILDLIDQNRKYNEHFYDNLTLPNLDKLDESDPLRIVMNDLKTIIVDNYYFGSKYNCDNLLLKLDLLCSDYLDFQVTSCNYYNFNLGNIVNNIEEIDSLETKKTKLLSFLNNEVNTISNNTQLSTKINLFVNTYFNEYVYNCS